ncbi:hypothetical protein BC832DRAFT_589803 [Gaertneriomyces semiglobifer]|nr:hypothetical protein BC832DRAFT_589803 [Gaertneriomyces semiglobifer]
MTYTSGAQEARPAHKPHAFVLLLILHEYLALADGLSIEDKQAMIIFLLSELDGTFAETQHYEELASRLLHVRVGHTVAENVAQSMEYVLCSPHRLLDHFRKLALDPSVEDVRPPKYASASVAGLLERQMVVCVSTVMNNYADLCDFLEGLRSYFRPQSFTSRRRAGDPVPTSDILEMPHKHNGEASASMQLASENLNQISLDSLSRHFLSWTSKDTDEHSGKAPTWLHHYELLNTALIQAWFGNLQLSLEVVNRAVPLALDVQDHDCLNALRTLKGYLENHCMMRQREGSPEDSKLDPTWASDVSPQEFVSIFANASGILPSKRSRYLLQPEAPAAPADSYLQDTLGDLIANAPYPRVVSTRNRRHTRQRYGQPYKLFKQARSNEPLQ